MQSNAELVAARAELRQLAAERAALSRVAAQARAELRRYAQEQAGLRRVATLVAGAAPPATVFAAVAEEVGSVLPAAEVAYVGRYDSGHELEFVGGWSRKGDADLVGHRVSLGGQNVATLVFETSEPARVEHAADDNTAATGVARRLGTRSGAGAPINVEGRLWGVMTVGSVSTDGLPAGIERRLAEFTELVATAIANAQARVELRDYAEEQAALRRLAMLVARAAPPEELFGAATAEIGRVLGADFTGMSRYDEGGLATAIGVWARPGITPAIAIGDRMSLGGRNLTTLVVETGQPVRINDYDDAPGAFANAARASGFRSGVGAPISAGGRLWGVVTVGTGGDAPMPPDTEARLAGFTELVATAIANAEARAELIASRARIVAAADETRRRIELDLHDGAQQRLVSLAVQLRAAQAKVPAESGELAAEIGAVTAGLNSALMELRDYARGIHPAFLATSGLAAALRALARRSPVPVELDLRAGERLPERVEVTAYYTVSEALANAAKHANASIIRVRTEADHDRLRLAVTDDGVGGADQVHGSGLVGLKDRVAAAGGTLTVRSRPGKGTQLVAELPVP